METKDILKGILDTDGADAEEIREKLDAFGERVKAEFLAELPGAEDEITIKRGDFAIRVREILARVNRTEPGSGMFAYIAQGMKNKMIAVMMEREFFGEAETEGGDDEK